MATANPFAGKARTASVGRSAEDLMDGGSSVAAKWPKEGFVFKGDVIGWSPEGFQMTHKDSGEYLFWEGKVKTEESRLQSEASKQNPCMQITIEFQSEATGVTWESNRYIRKTIEDDDGVRTAWIPIGSQLMKAINKARREAAQRYKLGRPSAPLEVGAHVEITRTEDKLFPNGNYGHTFTAVWTPAANNPNHTDSLLSDDDPWESTESSAPTAAPEDDEPPF
jgi:hypothetical protein